MIDRGNPLFAVKKNHVQVQSRGMFDIFNNVDRVPSNVQFSHQEALLYVFGDNEAVIKMIIKGRSPTMRHVSRTHRVAIDWFVDRINLDPQIQIKYIDTKNQLAYMLTKGNFTRGEWKRLLCLFNISHFSCTDCSEVMSKRTHSGEEGVTAKSRRMMSLVARAPSTLSSSASESPGRNAMDVRVPGVRKLRQMTQHGATRCRPWRKSLVNAPPQRICWKFVLSTLLKVGRWQSLVFSRVESW